MEHGLYSEIQKRSMDGARDTGRSMRDAGDPTEIKEHGLEI
jgi:hypothetical protein